MKIWVSVFDNKGNKIEEKELRDYRITADEKSLNHKGLPRLKIIGGMQSPLDFALWAPNKYNASWNYVLSCKDERLVVLSRGATQGNYIAVRGKESGTIATFVHVDGHDVWSKGKVINQGRAMCKVAITEHNGGFPAHLHVDMVRGVELTRSLIFYKVSSKDPKDIKIAELEKQVAGLTSQIQAMQIMHNADNISAPKLSLDLPQSKVQIVKAKFLSWLEEVLPYTKGKN